MKDIQQLLQLHKEIYNYTKKKAHGNERGLTKEIVAYQNNLTRYSKRKFKISTEKTLLKNISTSNIIYVGDFHTFEHNGKNLRRIIEQLLINNNTLTVALEMIEKKHQLIINQYLNGTIDETKFLLLINYKETWRFPWSHYRPIFELAKKHKFKITGINTTGPLIKRDKFISQQLVKWLKRNKKSKLVVFLGELHIVPNKIPALVKKQMDSPSIKDTIIHQNLDTPYWKTRKQNKSAKIIKFNNDEFSIQTAPPWIKYESMAYWHEHMSEDPEFYIHDYIVESGNKALHENINEHFLYMCHKVCDTLDLKIPKHKIENYNIYDHYKIDYVFKKISKIKDKRLQNLYFHFLKINRTFLFFNKNTIYCPNNSVNRLAYSAGLHIANILLKQKRPSLIKEFTKHSRIESFLLFLEIAMYAYYINKIFNPYLKCDLYKDIKKISKSNDRTNYEKKFYDASLKIINSPQKTDSILKGRQLKAIHEIAMIVGHFLSELIFNNFKQKKILISFSKNKTFSQNSFIRLHSIVLGNMDYKKTKKRVF